MNHKELISILKRLLERYDEGTISAEEMRHLRNVLTFFKEEVEDDLRKGIDQ